MVRAIVRSLRGQYFNARYLAFVASIVLLALVMFVASGNEGAFRSSEVRFSDASSRSGLSIVPASCPSYPHTEGECNCTPAYYCSGDDRWYIDATCVDSFVETCPYGCSGGVCLPPPEPTITSFKAIPSLIQRQETTVVSWETQNVTSCTVVGTNGDAWSGISGTQTSGVILSQTIYTLECTGEYGGISDTAIVNIIPVFQET